MTSRARHGAGSGSPPHRLPGANTQRNGNGMPHAPRQSVSILTNGSARRLKTDGRRRRFAALAALAAGLPLAPADAGDWQSVAAIEATAEEFVTATSGTDNARATATPLDRRLRLKACDRPLEAFLRNGTRVARRTIVGVRCSGSQPWKVYVPVDVAVTGDVYVSRRSLPRGHLLKADDVERVQRDVSRLSGGYVVRLEQLAGQRLKQSLVAGSVITPAVLKARTLIRRGQTVTLQVQAGGLHIRMSGKALMDGALDQRIRVENAASNRVVEGLVRSAELVEVLVR